jgi:hypothetical protein
MKHFILGVLASCFLVVFNANAQTGTVQILSKNAPVYSVYGLMDSEGVTTQMAGTNNSLWTVSNVVADLNYLGIHKIRDADITGTDAANLTFEQIACNYGGSGTTTPNQLVMLIASSNSYLTADLTNGSYPLPYRMATIDKINAACPGSVLAVEGPNEIDNFPIRYTATISNPNFGIPPQGIVAGTEYGTSCVTNGPGNQWKTPKSCVFNDEINAANAVMLTLAQHYTGQDNFYYSGIQTVYYTGWGANQETFLPDPYPYVGTNYPSPSVVAFADNQHPYAQNGSPPMYWVSKSKAYKNENGGTYYVDGVPFTFTAADEPAYATEEGYPIGSNYLCDYNYPSNVTADIAGKQQLDYWLDGASLGIHHMFAYKLIHDAAADNPSDNFGIFDNNNQLTTEALYIHNFNIILNSTMPWTTGATITTPIPQSWTLSAADSHTYAETFEFSPTQEMVIIWRETQLCSNANYPGTGSVNPITHDYSHLYGNGASLITEYDPTMGTVPVKTSTTGNIPVDETDHPLIFIIKQ